MSIKRTRSCLTVSAGMLATLATCALADGPYDTGAPTFYAVPLPPPFTWTGLYFGGNIGGARASASLNDDFNNVSFDRDHNGFIGGVQVGYNYQVRNLVFGVEWDFDWTSIDTSGNVALPGIPGALHASADTEWVTTLAGRVGLALDRTLVYVKAGGGWVRNEARITQLATGTSISASDTTGGWLVGGGFEYAFAPNWTAKFEYDFLGLSDKTLPGFPGTRSFELERDIQQIKVGINFKLN
ncbi:MAG TPA: outer membrane beta-barrel protein [Hyphomicrobiaceae bacterium]|nr:outer membrane beta-barrel protein [Hyphomicrobiaceae bacterium]